MGKGTDHFHVEILGRKISPKKGTDCYENQTIIPLCYEKIKCIKIKQLFHCVMKK